LTLDDIRVSSLLEQALLSQEWGDLGAGVGCMKIGVLHESHGKSFTRQLGNIRMKVLIVFSELKTGLDELFDETVELADIPFVAIDVAANKIINGLGIDRKIAGLLGMRRTSFQQVLRRGIHVLVLALKMHLDALSLEVEDVRTVLAAARPSQADNRVY
jgi:hypothetical protein